MKLNDEFKFLKIDSIKRKNAEELPADEQYFYVLNVLDKENNPVRFFSFDSKLNNQLTKDIQSGNVKGLQNCLIDFELKFTNNNWNVSLENVTFQY